MTCPVVKASALACERDGRLLFAQLDLCLYAGQMLRIVGENGSGKTSLLRVLAGLLRADGGSVRLFGQNPSAVREQFLWLGHSSAVNGLLTAEENLAFLCALRQTATPEGIRAALAKVGLQGFEDVPAAQLSAGQRQRVALARLYLPAPRLWLLDEPFTALDSAATLHLEAHLAHHCSEGGAVVLTTHHDIRHKPKAYAELLLRQQPSTARLPREELEAA